MDFNLKIYKQLKIKYYLKTVKFFFFFHGTSIKNNDWIKIEQSLSSYNLKYYRILNKLTINILNNSIFKNLIVLIHGPILILNSNNTKLTLKALEEINPLIRLLSFRLNHKIYSKKQIKNFKSMSYIENVNGLHNSLKTLTKMPYSTFKLKKKLPISE